MAKQALDVEFHWVTEHGQDGRLTAGATVKATVSHKVHACLSYADCNSMTSSHVLRWMSPSWALTKWDTA